MLIATIAAVIGLASYALVLIAIPKPGHRR